MKKLLILCWLLPSSLFSQVYIIKDVNLLDVEKNELLNGISVLVQDGEINAIAAFEQFENIEADSILDGKNKYLMPGMTDSHIHFFQSGGIYTRPDALDLRAVKPYTEEIEFAKQNAADYLQRYLRQGITTVMDVGGPMWNFTVRDSIAENMIAPNVLVTGPLFSMVARPKLDEGDPPIINMKTKEDVEVLFEKQLAYSPDFVKVWYVVSKDRPAEDTYPLVKYLADLCHQNKLKLAVHATQYNTAKLAVKADADVLVHSIDDALISDKFINKLKKKNIVYIPTLTVMEGYYKTFMGDINHRMQDLNFANPEAYGSLLDPNKIDTTLWPQTLKQFYGKALGGIMKENDFVMKENLRALSDAGIIIASGTDAGNIGTMHASSYFNELKAMQSADLSNWEIIKYSTINPAIGFGIASKTGSIKEGKLADMVLLNQNPLDSLEHLQSIEWVMKSGKLLEPGNIVEESPEQVVQRQVNAYNARNIDAFAATFSEDIKVYSAEGQLMASNREELKAGYKGMFERVTNLYCEIENRIVINNKVIDKERVRFMNQIIHAVAVYTVEDGFITECRFIE